MLISIIMMNIRHIFITTGISVLFGVYSIYNIIEYLQNIHYNRSKEISDLKLCMNDIKTKYTNLQSNYDNLKDEIIKTNHELSKLHLQISELHSLSNNISKEEPIEQDIQSETVSMIDTDESIICDEKCDLNIDIPRLHLETMNSNNDNNVDLEFVGMSTFDYDHFQNTDVNTNNLEGSIHSISSYTNTNSVKTSRSRSGSVTDINWTGLTKKFLFG